MNVLRVFVITALAVASLQAAKATPVVSCPVDLLQTQPKPPPPPPNPLDLFRKKKKDSVKASSKDTVTPPVKDTTKKKRKFSFPKIKLPPRPGENPPPTPPGK